MEITKSNYNTVKNLISLCKKGQELEVRIYNNDYDNNLKLDYTRYKNIINNLIFSKKNGGLELEYEINTSLDIIQGTKQVRINGIDNIKNYYLHNTVDEIDTYNMVKTRINTVDIDEYFIRFSLCEEKEMDKIKLDKSMNKVYRYKHRYSIKSLDGLFRYDLTNIRMGEGISFELSKVLNQSNSYEIEIEYIGDEKDINKLTTAFFKNINIILKLYQDNPIIIKKSEIDSVIHEYRILTQNNRFICINACTLHIKHLLEESEINILTNYSIMFKADGDRNLLFINKNGDCFFINNNFYVRKIGIKLKGYENTLIEGELIKHHRLYLAYNIIYYCGTDIRKKILYSDKNTDTRLSKMEEVINKFKDYKKYKIVQIEYQISKKNIFNKIKLMLDNKPNYPIDGLIFTPINEAYPNGNGTWNKLLKWKPVNMNSIDFLINTEKNKFGIDQLYPYSNTSTNEIYQYKVLHLKVGGFRQGFNKNSNKWIKKRIPKRFNPYKNNKLDNKPKGDISKAKIRVNENCKMIFTDPITKEPFEIEDDTIVEFVYDKNLYPFCWVPIRLRSDKTEKYKLGQPMYGNTEEVANDNWLSIMYPVTEEMIKTGNIDIEIPDEEFVEEKQEDNKYNIYNFHKTAKRNIMYEYGGGKLIDFNSAKGGNKEIWDEFELVVRLFERQLEDNNHITNIVVDLGEYIFPDYMAGVDDDSRIKLKDNVSAKYMFDIVSCFFAIKQYFENNEILQTFIDNVSDCLAENGLFIGIELNFDRIKKLMGKKKKIEGHTSKEVLWKIEKSGKNKYEITLRDNVELGYTVDFKKLDRMMKKGGFEKIKQESLEKMYDEEKYGMNEIEKQFSFLHDIFIYKKLESKKIRIIKT